MMLIRPPIRVDPAGDGNWGAPRGELKHSGVDFAVLPDSEILAPEDGVLGRYGYAYSGDPRWRIVDLHGDSGHRWRFFYCVQDIYKSGERVERGNAFAIAQDISIRYPDRGMKPHFHLEIFNAAEKRLNPMCVVV